MVDYGKILNELIANKRKEELLAMRKQITDSVDDLVKKYQVSHPQAYAHEHRRGIEIGIKLGFEGMAWEVLGILDKALEAD